MVKTGAVVELLSWHVDHGFPHVSEAALKLLFNDMEIVVPELFVGHDPKVVMKTELMSNLRDNWTQEDALVALNKCHRMEHPEAFCEFRYDEDLVNELILPKETSEFSKMAKDVEVVV